MSTAVVLQARMGSTRLPGKVLARIGRRSMLEHCIQRLSSRGHRVIVATTALGADDVVVGAARDAGAEVFRGHDSDVLERYRATAEAFGLTRVVRATADNPFVDADGITRTLAFQERTAAEHVIEWGMPIGTAVETVTAAALGRAASCATDPYDREHVTSLIRRDARFRALRSVAPGNIRRPGLRLTVDTTSDLEFIRKLWAALGDRQENPDIGDVIAAADSLRVQAPAAGRTRQGA
jgi:spore coat polysaccharide biosynthesis protein SpsF